MNTASLTLFLSIFVIVIATLFAGCEQEVTQQDIDKQKEKVAEAQDKLDALKERQQVEDEMQSRLADIEAKIEKLRQQAEQATGDREVELNGEIAQLQTRYEQATDRLRELRAASGDKWAQLKIKTEEAWQDVSKSVEDKMNEWNDKKRDDNVDSKSNSADDSNADDSDGTSQRDSDGNTTA